MVVPLAPLIGGSSGDPNAQYRDPTLRDLCSRDAKSYSGRMRIATAATLLRLRCAPRCGGARVRSSAAFWRALTSAAQNTAFCFLLYALCEG